MRLKTILAVTVGTAALLLLLRAAGGIGGDPVSPVMAPPPAPEPAAPPPLQVDRHTLPRGGTLDGLLQEAGFGDRDRLEVLDRLSRVLDLRRVPAGAGLAVTRDGDGLPVALAVRTGQDRFQRLDLTGDGDAFEEVEIPVRTVVRTVSGTVEFSVSRAFEDHPDAAALIGSFADIFQWDIDLLVEPRKGDRVRIVYEDRAYDALPPDLPPFRNHLAAEGDGAGIGRILAATYQGEIARSTAYWVEGGEGPGNYFDGDGTPLRKTFLKSPLNYRRISSRFSRARRNPVTRKVVPHHGVDFAAASGTPVVAAADGRVIAAGWSGALGRAIRVRHGSEYVTIYGHLKGFARGIRAGVQVRQNQVIGYVGASGRATGPHLHYSMLVSGRPVNPMTFSNPPVDPMPEGDRPILEAAVRRFGPELEPALALTQELADRPVQGPP